MNIKFCFIVIISFVLTSHTALAQQRSAKRGMCWDESTQPLTDAPISKMAPGVSWYYNWGQTPQAASVTLIGTPDGIDFVPMCWNGAFNETALREYLTLHSPLSSLHSHPYLLGFNEPNLAWNVGGAQMTPQQAADAWPAVRQVAQDFGLQLVAPALNFSGDQVGGRVWSPFEWYDEFFRLCPDSGIDFLAFHSYMNWYSAVSWVASEYFYTDANDNLFSASNRAKYPHLVQFMDDYLAAHGHYPRMLLTEFCAGEGNKDGYVSSVDSQIDQMTQKVQKLEQSDMVAGYAWFMGNTSQAPSQYPYNSVFQQNTPTAELSELGRVYVYMSSFDAEKYYTPGEQILAKDYIDASTDGQQAKVRSNSESGSDIPLQVEWQSGAWTAYQVTLPEDADYTLTLHIKSTADNRFRIYNGALGAANKLLDTTLPTTAGIWADVTTTVTLTAGQHTLLLYNMGTSSIFVNSLRFDTAATGIANVNVDPNPNPNTQHLTPNTQHLTPNTQQYYSLDGRIINSPSSIVIHNGKKIIIH